MFREGMILEAKNRQKQPYIIKKIMAILKCTIFIFIHYQHRTVILQQTSI